MYIYNMYIYIYTYVCSKAGFPEGFYGFWPQIWIQLARISGTKPAVKVSGYRHMLQWNVWSMCKNNKDPIQNLWKRTTTIWQYKGVKAVSNHLTTYIKLKNKSIKNKSRNQRRGCAARKLLSDVSRDVVQRRAHNHILLCLCKAVVPAWLRTIMTLYTTRAPNHENMCAQLCTSNMHNQAHNLCCWTWTSVVQKKSFQCKNNTYMKNDRKPSLK